ncbi:hypothetical protein BCR39DRAFT_549092 [Naematelia encephala]|uniref:Cyclin-like domain-containing protein n=1 Tax=Naematelia encephala TaxID=71784 RepID=A0A1Y2AMM3_9TREE|nr:hypothetical protein BCR39DRAFT_549092 [Naematelia encephala]
MSSNFWTSSHATHWLLPRPAIIHARDIDSKYATPYQLYCLCIWLGGLIQKLGRRLGLRQTVIATATVFFRRFYLKNSYCETNPYLVMTACCFVAAKVEETPIHIKNVVTEAKGCFQENNIKLFPAEMSKLGEMEFYLLEDLDFHLVVFHPYRALMNICGREPADTGRFPVSRADEDAEMRRLSGGAEGEAESEPARIRRLMGRGTGEGLMEIEERVVQISTCIINDLYRTEIPLLYPPYVIALSALYLGFCVHAMQVAATNPNSNSSANTNTASTYDSPSTNTTTNHHNNIHTNNHNSNNNNSANNHHNSNNYHYNNTRTRASTANNPPSAKLLSRQQTIAADERLGLPPPPKGVAEFIASFQVSLPVLLACVQEIMVLYPIWESFEPSSASSLSSNTSTSTTSSLGFGVDINMSMGWRGSRNGVGAGNGTGSGGVGIGGGKKDKFGPEEAEALIRKMIEERMVDLNHPDNAGKEEIVIGKKRPRGG